jgi:hypothetical protein
MNDSPNDSRLPLTERKVVRRGIIAGIAGFGAAALAKAAGAGKAEATTYTTLNNLGASTETYGLLSSPGGPGSNPVLPVVGSTNHGVIGSNTGVVALPMSSGVAGARNASGTAGVLGANGNGAGVLGVSDSGAGVQGQSTSYVGLRGISQSFVGLVGISSGSIGLYGYTTAASVPAFYAENLSGPGTSVAGFFYGDVTVQGNFTVTGGAKNAAVPMPDGSEAVVYCQESPEPYFEDFGRGQLTNGVANVDIEREFASIVRREDYMVFLTPGGDSKGLYVSRQTPQGFEVREAQGGKSSLPFTYRIVARRKDIEGKRLARVDPKIKANLAAMRANTAAKQNAEPSGLRNAAPAAGSPLVPIGPEIGTLRPGTER